MLGHEFECTPTVKVRSHSGQLRVSASPRFNGFGGVTVILDVPPEPPAARAEPGSEPALVTFKVWSRPTERLEPVNPIGAPDVTRVEQAPLTEMIPGTGYDPNHPPRYYGIATKIFIDQVEVDACSAVFSVPAGALVRDFTAE